MGMPPLQWNMVVLGCIGGLLPDVIRFVKGRFRGSFPGYLKRPMFWFGLLLLIALGGFAAWLLGASDAKQAIAYGFGAPELLSKLASKPVSDADRKLGFSLREWWAS
jgi:hypothetical protein